jgi:hypothetical protein
MKQWQQLFRNAAHQGSPKKAASGDTPQTAADVTRRTTVDENRACQLAYLIKRMETLQLGRGGGGGGGAAAAAPSLMVKCMEDKVEMSEMVLLIYVKEAKRLANLDEFSHSDPYLDVALMNNDTRRMITHRCTEIVEDALAPKWNELFAFDVDEHDLHSGSFSLECTIFDHDHGSRDQHLGSLAFNLGDLPEVRGSELGNSNVRIEQHECEYVLKEVPETSGSMSDSRLTVSAVIVPKLDFIYWCERLDTDPAACLQHGKTIAMRRALQRAQDLAHEVVDKGKRENWSRRMAKGESTSESNQISAELMVEQLGHYGAPSNVLAPSPLSIWRSNRSPELTERQQKRQQRQQRDARNLAQLKQFYSQHDPSKVEVAAQVLKAFPRAKLVSELKEQYGAAPTLLGNKRGNKRAPPARRRGYHKPTGGSNGLGRRPVDLHPQSPNSARLMGGGGGWLLEIDGPRMTSSSTMLQVSTLKHAHDGQPPKANKTSSNLRDLVERDLVERGPKPRWSPVTTRTKKGAVTPQDQSTASCYSLR